MRLRTATLTLAAFALLNCFAVRAQEQQNDQKVIDDFVTTRGVIFYEPGSKPKKQAAPAPAPRRNSSAKSKRPGGSSAGEAAVGKTPAGKGGAAVKPNGVGVEPEVTAQAGGAVGDGAQFLKAGGELRPLALGFTVFMKGDDKRLTFVEPTHEFKTDDRIAIAFETNADGYLYMFNASGGAKTLDMVFPDALTDGGVNAIQAHTYETFPTDDHDFAFTDPPATEHVFVVFSRKPLADVPTSEELLKFCRGKGEDCTWRLSAAQWERIRDGLKGRRVTEAKNAQLAQAAPQPELPGMIQRGLKVKPSAPKPAFVRVNDSPDADILVTEIVLTHK